jgi:hypothetical protein
MNFCTVSSRRSGTAASKAITLRHANTTVRHCLPRQHGYLHDEALASNWLEVHVMRG